MDAPARLVRGFTVKELLVAVAVIAVLVSLALPVVSHGTEKRVLIHWMSAARAIHIATMSMAYDGKINHDSSLGWPGDLKANGKISTLSDFVNVLVRNDYLKPGDLKVFSGLGYRSYEGVLSSGSNGVLIPSFKEENSALKVYLVKDVDPANTVFLASKNYTYNSPLDNPKAEPFGDKGFVVLRKGGDAAILKREQAQSLNLVGTLPGGTTIESAKNCLNPDPKAP